MQTLYTLHTEPSDCPHLPHILADLMHAINCHTICIRLSYQPITAHETHTHTYTRQTDSHGQMESLSMPCSTTENSDISKRNLNMHTKLDSNQYKISCHLWVLMHVISCIMTNVCFTCS